MHPVVGSSSSSESIDCRSMHALVPSGGQLSDPGTIDGQLSASSMAGDSVSLNFLSWQARHR